jgi:hypothetical protein
MNENTNEVQLNLDDLNILHLDSSETTESNLQELINNSEINDFVAKAINNFNSHEIFIDKVLSNWIQNQESERSQRSSYGKSLLKILGFQLFIVNLIVILIGCNLLHYEKWLINIFISSVFIEVIGLVAIIVKSLFQSNNGTELNEIIKLTLEKTNSDKETN